MTAREHLKKLVEVMQRADPAWCAVMDLEPVMDDEWDTALGEAEKWLEENP